MNTALIVIGNRNYSSWSLRGWLALKKSGAVFTVKRLAIDTPEFHREIGRYSPTRRVPALHHDGLVVWDSLAIAEYANETFAGGALWPADAAARAQARAASAEMHAGFPALRAQMPMNCRATGRSVPATAELRVDIERVRTIWHACRERFAAAGPWLFGRFSIADAMYAPVASRFRTYGVVLDGIEAAYATQLLGDADVRSWFAAAAVEREVISAEEIGR
jgi:glutathione S-transferase